MLILGAAREKRGEALFYDDEIARITLRNKIDQVQDENLKKELLAAHFKLLRSARRSVRPIHQYKEPGRLPRRLHDYDGMITDLAKLKENMPMVRNQLNVLKEKPVSEDFEIAWKQYRNSFFNYHERWLKTFFFAYRDTRLPEVVQYRFSGDFLKADADGSLKSFIDHLSAHRQVLEDFKAHLKDFADKEIVDKRQAGLKELTDLTAPGVMMVKRPVGDEIMLVLRDSKKQYHLLLLEFNHGSDFMKVHVPDRRDSFLHQILLDFYETAKKYGADENFETLARVLPEKIREHVQTAGFFDVPKTVKNPKTGKPGDPIERMEVYSMDDQPGLLYAINSENQVLIQNQKNPANPFILVPGQPLTAEQIKGKNGDGQGLGKRVTTTLGGVVVYGTILDAKAIEAGADLREFFDGLDKKTGMAKKLALVFFAEKKFEKNHWRIEEIEEAETFGISGARLAGLQTVEKLERKLEEILKNKKPTINKLTQYEINPTNAVEETGRILSLIKAAEEEIISEKQKEELGQFVSAKLKSLKGIDLAKFAVALRILLEDSEMIPRSRLFLMFSMHQDSKDVEKMTELITAHLKLIGKDNVSLEMVFHIEHFPYDKLEEAALSLGLSIDPINQRAFESYYESQIRPKMRWMAKSSIGSEISGDLLGTFEGSLVGKIQQFKEAGYDVKVYFEDGDPEAWWFSEYSAILSKKAQEAFLAGQDQQALEFFRKASRTAYQAYQKRDLEREGPKIVETIKKHPNAFHVVMRGLAHKDNFKKIFSDPSFGSMRIFQIFPDQVTDSTQLLEPAFRLYSLMSQGEVGQADVELLGLRDMLFWIIHNFCQVASQGGFSPRDNFRELNLIVNQLGREDILRLIRSFQGEGEKNPPQSDLRLRAMELFYRLKANFRKVFQPRDLQFFDKVMLMLNNGKRYTPLSTELPKIEEVEVKDAELSPMADLAELPAVGPSGSRLVLAEKFFSAGLAKAWAGAELSRLPVSEMEILEETAAFLTRQPKGVPFEIVVSASENQKIILSLENDPLGRWLVFLGLNEDAEAFEIKRTFISSRRLTAAKARVKQRQSEALKVYLEQKIKETLSFGTVETVAELERTRRFSQKRNPAMVSKIGTSVPVALIYRVTDHFTKFPTELYRQFERDRAFFGARNENVYFQFIDEKGDIINNAIYFSDKLPAVADLRRILIGAVSRENIDYARETGSGLVPMGVLDQLVAGKVSKVPLFENTSVMTLAVNVGRLDFLEDGRLESAPEELYQILRELIQPDYRAQISPSSFALMRKPWEGDLDQNTGLLRFISIWPKMAELEKALQVFAARLTAVDVMA